MKKQYMDFVPTKATATKPQTTRQTTRQATPKNTTKAPATPITKASKPLPQTTSKVSFAGEKPALGKIENLNTRFVKSDVPKRPLSRAQHFTTTKTGVSAIKAQKVGLNSTPTKSTPKASKPTSGTYHPPKTPFISSGKVNKRPLSSKNVYPEKPPKSPAKQTKGPVTIITKPEKQAHAGMIIAIVLTIILGAAAGTVAFLLLPK